MMTVMARPFTFVIDRNANLKSGEAAHTVAPRGFNQRQGPVLP
jgi:hypothetical protein